MTAADLRESHRLLKQAHFKVQVSGMLSIAEDLNNIH